MKRFRSHRHFLCANKIKNMKKVNILSYLLIAAFAISSCSNNPRENDAVSNQNENELVDTTLTQDTIASEDTKEESNDDWDKMLDDYEAYVTEYAKLYKKAMKGDNSALAEYPAIMEKATNFQQSMDKAKDDSKLTAEQIARMFKIQAKMVEAMK